MFLFSAADGWTTDDLVFLWRRDDPVQITKNLMLPRFALERSATATCNSKTNTGTLSSIALYPFFCTLSHMQLRRNEIVSLFAGTFGVIAQLCAFCGSYVVFQ